MKEYYEIVNEARNFLPTDADFVYRNAFLIRKLNNLQSYPSSNCFVVDVWKNQMMHASFNFLTFLFLFVSHFTQVW